MAVTNSIEFKNKNFFQARAQRQLIQYTQVYVQIMSTNFDVHLVPPKSNNLDKTYKKKNRVSKKVETERTLLSSVYMC